MRADGEAPRMFVFREEGQFSHVNVGLRNTHTHTAPSSIFNMIRKIRSEYRPIVGDSH